MTPNFYKYLDINGARLSLGNKNFKHADPTSFNDTEELTVQNLYEGTEEEIYSTMLRHFHNVISNNLDAPSTALNSRIRQQITFLQGVYKNNPAAIDIIRSEIEQQTDPIFEDIDAHRKQIAGHIAEINHHMKQHRIFCVTDSKNNERMWECYAQNHEGVVLRIVPDVEKNSKFTLFRRVEYKDTRPALYRDAGVFFEESLFSDQKEILKTKMDQIIYTKTREWEYENEWRLAIPVFDGESWSTDPYHPGEIVEIYLGLDMSRDIKAEMINLAREVNPNIEIFETFRDRNEALSFRSAQATRSS